MKSKLKQEYEKQQKKQKAKTILKWVFCGVGWTALLSAFIGLTCLGVKSCNKKQESNNNERVINRQDTSNVVYEIDSENGTITPSPSATFFDNDLQLNDYDPYTTTVYDKNYMTWGQYTWDRQTARNSTYNSWWSSNQDLQTYVASLSLNFNNLNNASNHYIGESAPMCELIYTYTDFSSVGSTQIINGGYDIHEITAINMYDDYMEFKHIRNSNYSQRIYYAELSQNGRYDSDRGYSRTIKSLTINFYRFYKTDIYGATFGNGNTPGLPLIVRYGLSESQETIFDIFRQHMTFNKMFFNFENYYIENDLLKVAPPHYHFNMNQDYVSNNSYVYESTNPLTQTYTLGYGPNIEDNGSSGGTSNGLFDAFALISQAFNSIGGFLNIEILPGIKFATLFAVPIVLTLVLFVVWLFKR